MEAQRLDVGGRPDAGADPHRIHRPVGGALVEREQLRRDLGDPLGDREHGGVEFLDGVRPVRGPRLDGFDAGHGVTGQQRLHPPAQTHQPGLPLHVRRRHQPDRRVPDLRVLGDVHEVTRCSQLGASGEAVSVDLPDDRRRHVPHLEPVVDDVTAPPSVRRRDRPLDVVVHRAEVVAGAEGRAVAADHDHRHVAVAVGGPQCIEQRTSQVVVECVALVRSVEREPSHLGQRIVDEEHGLGLLTVSSPVDGRHTRPLDEAPS